MSVPEFYELNTGDRIPSFGLGTWKSQADGETERAVLHALESGYKHIDCARIYCNEHEIGRAFGKWFADHPREDIWITSKLWNNCRRKEHVREACVKTLKDLQIDYLDLYLIHWPVSFVWKEGASIEDWPDKLTLENDFLFPPSQPAGAPLKVALDNVPIQETWQALEALVDEGLVRNIGICNFDPEQIEEILSFARIRPAVSQNERHPYLVNTELLEFCKTNGIHFTSYSPLGTRDSRPDATPLLENEKLVAIAAKYNKEPANIALRWGLQSGTSVIPKSVTPSRIESNMRETLNFTLSEEDMATLNDIGFTMRYCDPTLGWGSARAFKDSPELPSSSS